LILLNLEDADNQIITDFLNKYSDYPFADRLRGEYLKKLAKKQDWTSFSNEISNYQLEDPAVACYAAESSAINGTFQRWKARKHYGCRPMSSLVTVRVLYDRMQAAGILTEEDIWERFRLALAEGRVNLAKAIVKRSKTFDANQYKLIDKAYTSPTLVLNKKLVSFKTRFGHELNLFALNRIAKTDSQQALSAYKNVEDLFKPDDRSYFYGRLALLAAQRQEPQALQWFQRAENTFLTKEQLAWCVRAALREKNWPMVLKTVAKMSSGQADEGACVIGKHEG